jgi:outer membrane protein OmpA-like peptidoglycan-associated protein
MSRKVIVSTFALASLIFAAGAMSVAGCQGELNIGTVPSAVPTPPPPPVSTTPPDPPPPPAHAARPAAKVEGNKVSIPGEVEFDFGKPTIRETKQTTDVLTTLKDYLDQNPNVGKLNIEGHTDNVGTKDSNQKLSQERAANVVSWLVAKGVKKERLVSVGYGDTRPKATNDTEEHKQQNRRTEFVIAEMDGKPVPQTTPTGAAPPAASGAASAAASAKVPTTPPKK